MTFSQWADGYFAQLAADPDNTYLSFDIETGYSINHSDESDFEQEVEDWEILRISFSYVPGTGVSVLWSPTYMPTIQRLLESSGKKLGWNCYSFDVPLIERYGMAVAGEIHDGQDALHLLQSDLPKGLEWATSVYTDLLPWKHLNTAEPALYSAIDADAALRSFLGIVDALKQRGQWNLYINHVVRLMPILDEAGKRGNLTNREVRDEIRSRLQSQVAGQVAELQGHIDRSLFPRTLYKRQPEGIAEALQPSFVPVSGTDLPAWDIRYEPSKEKVCSHCRQFASNKTDHFKGSLGPLNAKGKPTRVKNPCKEAQATINLEPAFVPRFYRLEPFNPNSSDQLKAFMRFHNHPIGVDKKDSKKETADAGHLKKLAKDYPKFTSFYRNVLDIHKATKTIGTYTPEADAEGFLHTRYTNTPSTWRFSSKKVLFGTQIQNWGKREENKYAKEARKQIIARPGHKLVQIDSSAVEAVMQGYYMNDYEYMNTASQSIHAWLACKKLGMPFTPANVEIVKSQHETLYLQMKVVNYLTNFSGGPKLMTDTYPELFPTKKDAEQAQDAIYALLPSLKEYHHAQRWEAHKLTFLKTPWGYRHYFYDVFKRKNDGTLALSKDGKRCVAFRPQNSNAAFQKDNLLLLAATRIGEPAMLDLDFLDRNWPAIKADIANGETWAKFMGTNVSVHDSCCLDVPEPLVVLAEKVLMDIFTRPIPQMRGLRVGAEVEVGDNWGDMHRTAKKVMDGYTAADTEAGAAVRAA